MVRIYVHCVRCFFSYLFPSSQIFETSRLNFLSIRPFSISLFTNLYCELEAFIILVMIYKLRTSGMLPVGSWNRSARVLPRDF